MSDLVKVTIQVPGDPGFSGGVAGDALMTLTDLCRRLREEAEERHRQREKDRRRLKAREILDRAATLLAEGETARARARALDAQTIHDTEEGRLLLAEIDALARVRADDLERARRAAEDARRKAEDERRAAEDAKAEENRKHIQALQDIAAARFEANKIKEEAAEALAKAEREIAARRAEAENLRAERDQLVDKVAKIHPWNCVCDQCVPPGTSADKPAKPAQE